MQMRTVMISAGVHAAIGLTLMRAEEQRRLRRPTDVTVVQEKKEPKKEKPPERKPPPPPPKAAPKPQAAPAAPKAAPPPVAAPAPAAVQSFGLHLSNDGPGLAIGTGAPVPKAAASAAPRPHAVAARPPPVAAAGPAECTEEATKPTPVVKINPEYTDAARAAGIEGRLVVRIYVGADGSVVKVEVVSCVDPALDAAAIATIQKWRFTPAMKCGKPVEGGVYVFAQRFELAGD